MKFVPTRHYTPASGRRIDVIVFHTMEAPEGDNTAESVARYFQTTDRSVSSHYCIDNDSIVQCVREKDIAWGAPGANTDGIQLEHAGYARQSRADWMDDYSQAMLHRSARLAALICRRYGIPPRWLGAADLVAGRRGITSHANVSKAFHGSTHWDPGTGFPHEQYVSLVGRYMAPPKTDAGWFKWAAWWLGEGAYRGKARARDVRPDVPARIPRAWWGRLAKFVARRKNA